MIAPWLAILEIVESLNRVSMNNVMHLSPDILGYAFAHNVVEVASAIDILRDFGALSVAL